MTESALKKNLISNGELCYWELKDNTSYWSEAFIKELGYDIDDITIKLDFFLDNIINKEYRESFKSNFYNLVRHDVDFKQNISLQNKDGESLEYICKTNEELDVPSNDKNSKIIFFFKSKLKTHEKLRDDSFYYIETAAMTSTGSWYIDFENKKSHWDSITRKILEYPEDFIPSLKMAMKLYAEEHLTLAANMFFECSLSGKPFDVEILMVTAKNRKFWVRAMGKPVFNDNKEVIGIRGIFQDIDDNKQKEIHLEKTSEIIASQNSRLFNFAHIVSHNLRSHSSNLSLIVQLINNMDTVEEKLELIDNIKNVSRSLNTTIEHLNEVVNVHTNADQQKEIVNISSTLKQVCRSISQIITNNNVTINSDFELAAEVNYIPAYLESILLNLITNAIKYKHEDRDPVISVKTSLDYTNNDSVILEVKDNGIGIDLEKRSTNSFGYKLIDTLLEQLEGEMQVKNDSGTQLFFTFNDYKIAA